MKVCVLLGGDSPERAISITSGLAVGGSAERSGHDVWFLDPATGEAFDAAQVAAAADRETRLKAGRVDPKRLLASLMLIRVETDVVANILHGGRGEGGAVQTVLEMRGLSYFGSGSAACAVAMDKVLAKRVLAASQVPVADDLLWGAATPPPSAAEIERLGGYPIVVKPISAGSSVGVTIVQSAADWPAAWEAGREHLDPARGLLVESFIPGRELTVGVLGDEALPVVEIVPHTGFYDYARKYTAGASDYRAPAELEPALASRLREIGLAAFRALGCRDYGRVDLRMAPDGRVAVLEVNTVPGMTATSLLPKAAAAVGIPFDDLVERLCKMAHRSN